MKEPRVIPMRRWPFVAFVGFVATLAAVGEASGAGETVWVCLPVGAVALLSAIRPPTLSLSAQGFSVPAAGSWFQFRRTNIVWHDVDRLFLWPNSRLVLSRKAVCWTFQPQLSRKGLAGPMLKGAGIDGYLMWFSIDGPELLAVMEDYRSSSLSLGP